MENEFICNFSFVLNKAAEEIYFVGGQNVLEQNKFVNDVNKIDCNDLIFNS